MPSEPFPTDTMGLALTRERGDSGPFSSLLCSGLIVATNVDKESNWRGCCVLLLLLLTLFPVVFFVFVVLVLFAPAVMVVLVLVVVASLPPLRP